MNKEKLIKQIESEHFTADEFSCRCCGLSNMSQEFIDKLDIARSFSKTPYIITSGSRCRLHNTDIGGHPESMHLATIVHESEACDISANTARKRHAILYGLFKAGFSHIGIGKDFIHVDISKRKGVWGYY